MTRIDPQSHVLLDRAEHRESPVRVCVRRAGDGRVTQIEASERLAAGGISRRRVVVDWPAGADSIELEVVPRLRTGRPPGQADYLIPSDRQTEFPGVARVDPQFRFVDVSPEYADMLGYDSEHLLNLLCDSNVHPEDAPLVQQAHEQLSSTGVVEYESRAFRADESCFWQRVLMVEDRDADGRLIGYYRYLGDVSVRRNADAALERREERLRAFLSAMPDPMVRVSREGICIDCKLPAETSLGLPPGWFLGRNIRELGLPQAVVDQAQELIELTLYTGQLQLCEFDIEVIGDMRYFEGRVAPCGHNSVILIARDITDRRRAQNRLADNERFISRLANSSPALIYVFDLQRLESIYVNQEVGAFLGLDATEVRSMGPTPFFSQVHPEDAAGRKRQFLALASATSDDEEQYAESEYWVRHADGSWHWFYSRETVFSFDRDRHALQVMGVAIDITEQRLAADALRASEERLRLLAEHASDIISRNDIRGRFIDVSPACERILGYSVADMLEMGFEQIVCREDWPSFWSHYRDALESGDRGVVEFRARRKAGGLLWLEATVRLAKAIENSVSETVCVIRDISDRRRAERERERLQLQVYRAQRLDSLGVLAGGIAHDFNNLLFSVLGHAELALGSEGVGDDMSNHLEIIRSTAQRGRELTRQMLVYAGERSMEFCPTDLNEVIREMLRLMKVGLPSGVELEFDLAPNLPLVDGDVGQLNQVVMNLMTNAAESISDESGRVVFRSSTVELQRSDLSELVVPRPEFPSGPAVMLEVSDTGCGMDADTRTKVFEPFFSTKFTGRGLGLAAVLGIVRGHGGAIRLSSEKGKGTKFQIYFPLSASTRDKAAVESSEFDGWVGRGRALLVDDDPTVRGVVRRLLERFGLRVDEANDGADGVAQFAADPDVYNIVFLDLIMPRMGGAQALREIKRLRPDSNVVIFSGYGEPALEGLSEEHRPRAFLQKPVDMARIRSLLKEIL